MEHKAMDSNIEVLRKKDVPAVNAEANEWRAFVHRFDPAEAYRQLYGLDFTAHADTLDDVLTTQLQTGRALPEAPLQDLLLCFCRMWTMAPYLGFDSIEAFLQHPRARWLLEGIRRQAL